MKAKGAAQFGRSEMGAKAGAAPLEAPGGSEIANRNRIAAGVAHQLLCDVHRLRIVAGDWHAQKPAATGRGGFNRSGVHRAEGAHEPDAGQKPR